VVLVALQRECGQLGQHQLGQAGLDQQRETEPRVRRSAEMISMRPAMSRIAETTAGSTVKPSCAANRAARIIRSGSSENESSGRPGVRSSPCARSTTPPNGSTKSRDRTRTAIAFTVKSRRPRSPSRLSPKSTDGLREEASYSSER
jgi:hypothetical protein